MTANQRVIGTSFPHVITTEWVNPTRARRIVERLGDAHELPLGESGHLGSVGDALVFAPGKARDEGNLRE